MYVVVTGNTQLSSSGTLLLFPLACVESLPIAAIYVQTSSVLQFIRTG